MSISLVRYRVQLAETVTYIVVLVDRFSWWTEPAPVPDITAATVADAVIDHIVLRHGCPSQLFPDRGSQFLSKLFKRMAARLGITRVSTSAYRPETNGQVERINRYVAAALTSYVKVHQDDWDQYLGAIAFAYCTSVIDAIATTPFYLLHGRDPRLPTDVLAGTQQDLLVDARQYGLQITASVQFRYYSR